MLSILKVLKFFNQVKQELLKVIWPKKPEIFASFLVVIAVVICFSGACLILDYIIHSLVNFLVNIGE